MYFHLAPVNRRVYAMPMTTIKFNLLELIHTLEAKTGKRYGYAAVAAGTGGRVSRQSVRYLLNNPVERVELGTLAALIDFFKAEGMDVTPNDLLRIIQ
jgi:hypothetical protein